MPIVAESTLDEMPLALRKAVDRYIEQQMSGFLAAQANPGLSEAAKDELRRQRFLDRLTKMYTTDAPGPLSKALAKALSTTTSLQGYDLTGPAYDLYPLIAPFRNTFPRRVATDGSVGPNWKIITDIGLNTGFPFVAEGARNSSLTYTEADKSGNFRTIGFDDDVTQEAEYQARGFEDLRALSTASLLRRVMKGEEDADIGGITSAGAALGASGTVTLAYHAAAGTLSDSTIKVYCLPLTYFGYRTAVTTAGAMAVSTGSGSGYHGALTAQATITLNAGTAVQGIDASMTAIPGAVAYAWFVGLNTAERLIQITTTNQTIITVSGSGTSTLASAITAGDQSQSTKAYDGILAQSYATSSGAYLKGLATGTVGVGTKLTTDNAGGVTEINTALQSIWNSANLSPDAIYVNAQEMNSLLILALANASGTGVFRIQIASPTAQGDVVAGVQLTGYLNRFTGQQIALKVHPTLPPGTMVLNTVTLPDTYPGNKPEGLWRKYLLFDYQEVEYGPTLRKWEHGVYMRGLLQCFMPSAQGVIYNITAS